MVTAEYNSLSHVAHLSENGKFLDIVCSLTFFVKVISMFKKRYGKFSFEPVGEHGVFVTFNKGDAK